LTSEQWMLSARYLLKSTQRQRRWVTHRETSDISVATQIFKYLSLPKWKYLEELHEQHLPAQIMNMKLILLITKIPHI
jgi:hypothetical protein